MDNPNVDQHAAKLASLVFDLLANCQEKETRMAAVHGLTHSEFRCLRFLKDMPEATNKKLAEKMDLTPGRLTRILDGLARKKFMSRKPRVNDRRTVEIQLTSKGNALLERLEIDSIQAHKEILESMSIPHEELVGGMEVFLGSVKDWLNKT